MCASEQDEEVCVGYLAWCGTTWGTRTGCCQLVPPTPEQVRNLRVPQPIPAPSRICDSPAPLLAVMAYAVWPFS